jgi:hypothetical protein
MEMVVRAQVVQAVVDDYLNKPLVWGTRDCGQMAARVMIGLGVRPGISKFGKYRSPAAALKALKKNGFKDISDVLDAKLERIAVARARPGDLLGVPGEGMTALAVVVGNGKALAFAPDCIARIGQLVVHKEAVAWRVPCRKR